MRRSRKDLDGLNDPSVVSLRAALTAPPAAEELTGEAEVLSAYQAVSWRSRRSLRRPAVLATKLGAATVVGVMGLSGVATAAYTGSLPDTLQDVAHKTIKAPKAHPPAQAVGPDATGPAAYGLCQAFVKNKADKPEKEAKEAKPAPSHEPKASPNGKAKGKAKDKAHGKGLGPERAPGQAGDDGDRGQSKQKSVAYRNLVRAAGGEDKLEAYCATIPKPSGEPDNEDADEDADEEGKGKPTARPTHPTGKPTKAPGTETAEPKELPSPAQTHPTGSPSPLPTVRPSEAPAP